MVESNETVEFELPPNLIVEMHFNVKKFTRDVRTANQRIGIYNLPSPEMEELMFKDRERIAKLQAEFDRCLQELKKIELCWGNPADIKHYSFRAFYHQQRLKILRQDQAAFIHTLNKRKCLEILDKMGGYFKWIPCAREPIITDIPQTVLFECDWNLYPSAECTRPIRDWVGSSLGTGGNQYTSLIPVKLMTFLYSGRETERGSFAKINDLELLHWGDKIFWIEKGILPQEAVDGLLEHGLTEDEIQILYPHHKLPKRRLN